jgi:hypothetical protein
MISLQIEGVFESIGLDMGFVRQPTLQYYGSSYGGSSGVSHYWASVNLKSVTSIIAKDRISYIIGKQYPYSLSALVPS